MLFIIRNQHEYGPYGVSDIARYVEEGRLLLNDRARDAESGDEGTVEELLGARGIHPHVRSRGSLMQQLRYIGHAFIFPKDDMERHHLMEDKRLLILAIVGLSLSIIMLLPIGGYLVFYAVSLYFATIWGLFFSYFFRTRQISKGKAVSTFFLTQLGVFIIFSGLNELNFFYNFTSAPFPLSILGYILGIGLTEEFAKMIPLLVLERRAREPQLPQTMVFYGLMAGIAFGVFEGVQYQTSINIRADYTTAFVLNIARLTSLPFLHAVWAGICGYFVGMAGLYPQYRKSLYVLALAIPATLHGLYDLFAGGFYLISLVIAFLSVFLLMAYLRRSNVLREKLRR
jgi:RsiW-degrading membrane proteinase PrsW (M82 family)